MAEKPILFNTEMVRAILEGRKTVTRRVLRGEAQQVASDYVRRYSADLDTSELIVHWWVDTPLEHYVPYRPGDILYVRETWRPHAAWSGSYIGCEIEYKAGGENLIINDSIIALPETVTPWRPSIHMPREAARIWLRVTDVRVERLREIDEAGAILEGCNSGGQPVSGGPFGIEDVPGEWTAREHFSEIWNSTIKPADRDRYGWAANPWVWVIAFERTERPVTPT